MRSDWLAVAAVAALVVVPVLAFEDARSGGRASQAGVASDGSAFLHVQNLAPTADTAAELTRAEAFEAAVLTVRHDYAAASRLALEASLAPGSPSRFHLSNPTALLTPGASHTFKVEDLDSRHARVCTPLVLQVRATVVDSAGVRQGTVLERETVHVRVGRC